MKQHFIIGNWKSHKTLPETIQWLQYMKDHKQEITSDKTVILAPSFPLLYTVHSYVKEYALPLKIAAQDISPFTEGAYTGEVNGKQIKEFADYVIIGHSERRRYFSETEDMLYQKITMAQEAGLQVIYCVPKKDAVIPSGLAFVAYEPLDAISTSGARPVSAEEANTVAERFAKEHQITHPLYGGSVVPENVHDYASMPAVQGFLVGGASLDSVSFLNLIRHA